MQNKRAIIVSAGMAQYLLEASALLLLLALFWVRTICCTNAYSSLEVNRCSFPPDFVFGTSTAAYQCEGAVSAGGRTPSIWDTFSHQLKDKISDGSNGDTADDQYHRYQDDILLMKNLNMDAYRFSISWSRIYPDGRGSQLNLDAVAHYNSLIDNLLDHGIEPYVTLYHWDMPQVLEDTLGGWLSPAIVDEFAVYAEACFTAFGDRVKNWFTFNEPHMFAMKGYCSGQHAPGRCSMSTCSKGNSSIEPYIVSHHVLLAHAAAVIKYRYKYQAEQKGRVGIILNSRWFEPLSNSSKDIEAAERAMDFMLGWHLHPLVFGDYPRSMRKYVGDRLPIFKENETRALLNSLDFLALNYYTTTYAIDASHELDQEPNCMWDSRVQFTFFRNGVPIGLRAASDWLYIVPWGMRKLLNYIKEHYQNPTIMITENGIDEYNNSSIPLEKALDDKERIEFHHAHLSEVLAAMRDGVNVCNYFVWSLLDNYEWSAGYTVRFGLYYVDFQRELQRYPKASAQWFRNFLRQDCMVAKI